METYKSKYIREKLHVSKIQLSHWINMGAIKPYREDRRRGGSHEFNQQNVIEAAICKALSNLKVPVVNMVKALQMIQERNFWEKWKKNPGKEWFLITFSPLIAKIEFQEDRMVAHTQVEPGEPFYVFVAPDAQYFPITIEKKDLVKKLDDFHSGIFLDLKKVLKIAGGF